jgi:DNA-binding transcriptional regulator YiaG
MNELQEVWKDIENFENKYQVSTLGQIRSIVKEPKILKLQEYKGRYRVTLGRKTYKVHRLVAQTFVSNLHNKDHVNHDDGIRTNNRSNNLSWMTHRENQKHAVEYDLKCKGDNHPNAKLTCKTVKQIRSLKSIKVSTSKIAEQFHISITTVNLILRGKTWKHI